MGVTPVLEGLGQGAGIPQATVDQHRAGIDAAVGIRVTGAARPALGIGRGRRQHSAEQHSHKKLFSQFELRISFKII